jgi:HlyD family secretion protein
MKRILLVAAIVLLALCGFWAYRHFAHEEAPAYRFGAIERGDIEAAVAATGILSAVTTVQVGTQVSGLVSAIFTDFNGRVKKGQLIARIDPTLQQQAVQDAEAGLDRSRAELEKARLEYERNKGLFDNKVLTEVEFNTAKYAYQVAQASAKSAQIALERARRNLSYTSIYAPIDGVVVERNVDVGQTVTSSYSTPQLFLIAQDLSQMQILSPVDESDIGLIKEGQKVRFTVQAYPSENFEGLVSQVRLQSKTTENVVNYTVAVAVRNPGKLLPGMTATVEFLTGSASNVWSAPNAALRFRPPQELLEKMAKERPVRQPVGAGGPRTGNGAKRPRPGDAGTLWYLDPDKKLTPMRVRTGITDGQKTQVTGKSLREGMQAIVGVVQPEVSSANPFQQQGPQQPQRGSPRR